MTTGVTPIEYKWRDGAHYPVGPDVVGCEFERIAKHNQELVPVTVVEESRSPDAPLHSLFEWDNTAAADSWREEQAKKVIRDLKIVFIRNDTEEPLPPMRAYVSVIDEPDFEMYAPNRPSATRSYKPIVKVMSDEDLRDQYRRQAFDTLCNWRDRYTDIEDFARIFAEIDALRAQYLDRVA